MPINTSSSPSLLRIGIALSGGVDSAVTALLLRHLIRSRDDLSWWLTHPTPILGHPSLGSGATTSTTTPSSSLLFPFSSSSSYSPPPPRQSSPPTPTHLPCSPETLIKLIQHSMDNNSSRLGDNDRVHLVGYYMHNWRQEEHDGDDTTTSMYCEQSEKDRVAAEDIAKHKLVGLDDFKVVDFSAEYHHTVFERMTRAFFNGNTLNADTLCNRHIKFGKLLGHARRFVGQDGQLSTSSSGDGRCEYLATGHYAQTYSSLLDDITPRLLTPASRGVDLNDQTHFLSTMCRDTQLPYALFPLGRIFRSKADVREVATHFFGDGVGKKKTSTGLCFVNFPSSKKKVPCTATVTGSCADTSSTATNTPQPPKTMKRPVSKRSSFRDLLVKEFREKHVTTTTTNMIGVRPLSDVGVCLVDDTVDHAHIAPSYSATQRPTPHIININPDAIIVADVDVYPFDFAVGTKVQVRGSQLQLHLSSPTDTPSALETTLRQQKGNFTAYVCKRVLETKLLPNGVDSVGEVVRLYLTTSRTTSPLLYSTHFAIQPGTVQWMIPPPPTTTTGHPHDKGAVHQQHLFLRDGTLLVCCRHQEEPSRCTWDVDNNTVTLLLPYTTNTTTTAEPACEDGLGTATAARKWCITGGQTAVFYINIPGSKHLMVVASATISA